MTWVSWRLQRTEMLIAGVMLGVLALVLLPAGLNMASAYHHDGLAACLGPNPSWPCVQAIDGFTSRFRGTSDLIAWTTLLPGLFGVLLAAPFVLELESGTYRLAWTQSVTRGRWIAGKLGLAVAAAVVVAVALTAFLTWWHEPLVRLQGRMDQTIYDSSGIVVVGYTLFALGLALALGVLWRRAVPALVVAFGCYFASRLFVDLWLRQRLVSPASATWRVDRNPPASFHNSWQLTQTMSDAHGNLVVPPFVCGPRLGSTGPKLGVGSRADVTQCLIQHGAGYTHAVFQPASHFWPLQLIETGIFGGVALVLLAFAAWWTHRRAA